ncbi:MAG: pyrroloquinoline quinone biosynthesis peptide chaperone PqqD [Rhodospirillales bacterium]
MTDEAGCRAGDFLEINPMYLFRWEEAQQAHVLLYPEGIVKLNETAAEILRLCDGDRTVDQMIGELERKFTGDREGIASGVYKFLEEAHAKGWIRIKS